MYIYDIFLFSCSLSLFLSIGKLFNKKWDRDMINVILFQCCSQGNCNCFLFISDMLIKNASRQGKKGRFLIWGSPCPRFISLFCKMCHFFFAFNFKENSNGWNRCWTILTFMQLIIFQIKAKNSFIFVQIWLTYHFRFALILLQFDFAYCIFKNS